MSSSEADFVRALREAADQTAPPSTSSSVALYAAMSDLELQALWMYLRSVPPEGTGGK